MSSIKIVIKLRSGYFFFLNKAFWMWVFDVFISFFFLKTYSRNTQGKKKLKIKMNKYYVHIKKLLLWIEPFDNNDQWCIHIIYYFNRQIFFSSFYHNQIYLFDQLKCMFSKLKTILSYFLWIRKNVKANITLHVVTNTITSCIHKVEKKNSMKRTVILVPYCFNVQQMRNKLN